MVKSKIAHSATFHGCRHICVVCVYTRLHNNTFRSKTDVLKCSITLPYKNKNKNKNVSYIKHTKADSFHSFRFSLHLFTSHAQHTHSELRYSQNRQGTNINQCGRAINRKEKSSIEKKKYNERFRIR